MKTRWEKALGEQMAKNEWDPVPEAMAALPAPGKALLSRENAGKMIQELGAGTTTKKMNQVTDGKRWARNILARAERKNHGLADWIINDAKKALGVK